jgi:predicted nucleic acid-binding protein
MNNELHARALRIAGRYGISLCDARIVSTPLLANCKTLPWESTHDDQVVERQLTVRSLLTPS